MGAWGSARAGRVLAALRERCIPLALSMAGGYGLDISNSVQRAWRDANAAGRHISLNWDAVGTMYGQYALGLPPQGQY